MPGSPRIINRLDAERLQCLIDEGACERALARRLEAELARGEVLDPEEMPDDVVSMNSRVRCSDLETGRSLDRTLVYPRSLADVEDGVSVLSPAGLALFSRRVGEVVDWPERAGGVSRLRIDAILWQPERARQYHR
ncbi:nucleoside diphosphate kinase regulator [Halomonas beimenensis]|uniref:Regulator of nucleoside diphosphate kinase n=1 Tax=Halomonas beimenensis TaxID=475662 RepID=A0A291P3H9_9GAMM|nr:nucleoside diphosphate kinase regulator [Halomonas beimenensis]ATJ81441.1 hypothetical protein BEI_0454 [Halomonas beimenensis]